MWLIALDGAPGSAPTPIGAAPLIVGRDPTCGLVLDDGSASRRHASFTLLGPGQVEVRDLGSTNGVQVNGARITAPVVLRGGEEVRIGGARFAVDVAPAGAAATVIEPSAPLRPPPAPIPAPIPAVGSAPPTPPPLPAPPLEAAPPRPPAPPAGPGPIGPAPDWAAVVAAPAASAKSHVPLVAALVGGVAALVVVALVAASQLGGGGGALSTSDIVERGRPSTVLISADIGGALQGTGTGWVLDAGEGLIVTNQHVVNAGTSFSVGAGAGRLPAVIVGAAPCEDLAVLRVNGARGLKTLPLGDQRTLRQGDRVVALGYPGNASSGNDLAATVGVVSVVQTRFDEDALDAPRYPNVIQTDAAINPGNSGGPLIDDRGRLVGVNSAGITVRGGRLIQNQGYAIGVDRVKTVVAELRQGRSQGWTGMGLVFPSSEDEFDLLGLPVTPGAVLAPFAAPLSPAANAGFGQTPAALVGINGARLDGTLASYCQHAAGFRAGDTATFTVVLGSGEFTDVRVGFA